jgi:hypothetical protein
MAIVFCANAQQPLNPLYNTKIQDTSFPAVGSATKLKGTTLIVNFFISDKKNDWKLAEKQYILQLQQEGIEWLKKEAKYFGFDIAFATSNIGMDSDIKLGEIKGGDNVKRRTLSWIPTTLLAAGFASTNNFYDSINYLNKYDNVVVQIFANKDGRSFARPAYTNYQKHESFLEGCVVYKEWNGKETTAATIIHELLHCFGAKDIYKIETEDGVLFDKIKHIFNKSIMLNTHRDIKPLLIDQLNAWCIGWSKNYYSWYSYFTTKNIGILH